MGLMCSTGQAITCVGIAEGRRLRPGGAALILSNRVLSGGVGAICGGGCRRWRRMRWWGRW